MELGAILPQSRIDAMRDAGLWLDRTLLDYLDDAVSRNASAPAITTYNGERDDITTLSYADLDRLSRRIALKLLDLGIAPGDVVSLQLPNWWQFAAMHLACLRIGAITNPLMPIFRERELTYMLGFAESKLLIAPARFRGFDYRPMVDSLKPELPALRHALYVDGDGSDSFEAVLLAEPLEDAAGAADRLNRHRPDANDVIELIYTSGTTGQPKGVMHTSNTTLSHLNLWIQHHSLSADDVFLMASPLAHQTGFLYGILQPVMLGSEVILQDRWHPPLAAEIIQRHRCTFTMGATPFLNDIVYMPNVGNFDLSSLRTFVSAGAPIPPALVQDATANFSFKVLSGWGMSECACPCICDPKDPGERVWTSDGAPLRGSEVIVLNEDGEEAPRGEEGDLKIRGSSMFVGYLKRPDLHGTNADDWFDTGDRAYMTDDGYIRISGRSKDIIIRGGENIPVVELEDVLFRHPSVQDVAVVGAPDPRLGERGCAYVTLKPGTSLTFADMLAYLDEKGTAKQYWPEVLEVIDEMPRTPSGKIQKFKLREMASSPSTA